MNTWPKGYRHAMNQNKHEEWNTAHYPGTRQICVACNHPTERCEEDAIYDSLGNGPICPKCWREHPEYNA